MQSVGSIHPLESHSVGPSAARGRGGDPFPDLLKAAADTRPPRAQSGSPQRRPEETPEASAKYEPAVSDGNPASDDQGNAPVGDDTAAAKSECANAPAMDASASEESGQPMKSTEAAKDDATPAVSATVTPQPSTPLPTAGSDSAVLLAAAAIATADLSANTVPETADAAPVAPGEIAPTEIGNAAAVIPAAVTVPVTADAVSMPAGPPGTADTAAPKAEIAPAVSQAAPTQPVATANLSPDIPTPVDAESETKAAAPAAANAAPASTKGAKKMPVTEAVTVSSAATATQSSIQSNAFQSTATSSHPDATSPTSPAPAKDHSVPQPAKTADATVPTPDASVQRHPAAPSAPQAGLPEPVRALAATFNPASLQVPTASESNPVPLTGVALAVEIMSRAREGNRRFDIRLDPPELGRIDVRLDVDREGQATARLTVDRPETLNLLQREARGLEQALQSAGLKTENGGLEFSLRYQAQDGSADRRPEYATEPRPDLLVVEDSEAMAGIERYSLAAQARGGIDIQV